MLDHEPIPTPKARYAAETIPRRSPYSATETQPTHAPYYASEILCSRNDTSRARRQTEDEY